MKKITIILLTALAMTTATAMAQTTTTSTNVKQLENDIEGHEKAIRDKQDAIRDIEQQIDEMKKKIKDLEAQKKTLQREVKDNIEQRKQKFATRDFQVYDQEVVDVLYNPYNRSDVEDALKSFEGMETKDVIKKKELVQNYGEYTANLREFLEKQKKALAKAHWKYQSSTTDVYKKFEKGLKHTKYWKVYSKRDKNESIDYLDRVMDRIMLFRNSGLNNEAQFNEILNLLYAD